VGGWSTIWSLLPSGLRHLWKRLPRCAWPNVWCSCPCGVNLSQHDVVG
jgi:hypothetical protein